MTWKVVTTCILSCADQMGTHHTTHYRILPAPSAGDIVKCPHCNENTVVTGTIVTRRVYKGSHRER